MKRTVLVSLSAVAVLSGYTISVPGQPPSAKPWYRPSAAQLLEIPVSDNPIGNRPPPTIRNPYAGNANAIVQGEKLFNEMNCSGCHAPLGGGGMGPALSDQDWIYGGEPASIYLSIVQGRPNGMPSWGRSLPPESIWNLVAYIETLGGAPVPASSTPQKPAHPTHPVRKPMGLP
jgi:cytochrome c oxidase cbb3-type subunit 3